MPIDPNIRFWRLVEKTDTCWLWKGGTTERNKYKRKYKSFTPTYGVFYFFNKRLSPTRMLKKTKLAHRYSWELHFGPAPQHLCVLHKCDNPRCVRPDHLFLGTRAENTADMHAKGRFGGNKIKFTQEQLQEIRLLHRKGASQMSLANDFGVSQSTISRIIRDAFQQYLKAS